MTSRTRNAAIGLAILAPALLLMSCGVPFTVETDTTTVDIPVTIQFATGYDENRVELPGEALRDEVQYESVRFHYTATTDSSFTADVEIWISDDQETDGTYDSSNDDKIVDLTLSNNETKSGWAESDALVRALNAQQQYIVVGGFAESLSGGGTVTITLYAQIQGSVRAW